MSLYRQAHFTENSTPLTPSGYNPWIATENDHLNGTFANVLRHTPPGDGVHSMALEYEFDGFRVYDYKLGAQAHAETSRLVCLVHP